MPTMTLRSDLTPPDSRPHRLARVAGQLAKAALVAAAAAGLALFVAAPLIVGMSWPPGATELVLAPSVSMAQPLAGMRAPDTDAANGARR